MWRHPFFAALLLAYVGWGGWNWFLDRPVAAPAGILAPDEPHQDDIPSHGTVRMGRWTLTPRAAYRITARVLHVERYRFDALTPLIPEDLALGWGPMSENEVLTAMDISQSDRFYFWRLTGVTRLPKDVIISHSANTHVIPENARIAKRLYNLRRGQIVTLSGTLVDATRDDGAWIKTSLVRTDTGAGSCEVLLVHDVDTRSAT